MTRAGFLGRNIFSRRLTSVGVALLLVAASAPSAFAKAEHVRWDLISLNFAPPLTISAGGHASARAIDNSKITLTGSGTFVAPGGNRHTSSAVTGGGNWTICNPAATVCESGTYEVTGLVRWDRAPFAPGGPPPRTDVIDHGEPSTGLAVLRIAYSDGDHGTLVVSCEGVTSPSNMFEGITATKGFVDYWHPEAPAPGVDANRTLFHVRGAKERHDRGAKERHDDDEDEEDH
jgi:hypothetical protein